MAAHRYCKREAVPEGGHVCVEEKCPYKGRKLEPSDYVPESRITSAGEGGASSFRIKTTREHYMED